MNTAVSRRKFIGALSAAVVAAPVLGQAAAPQRILLRNVRIFDGVAPKLAGGHVLIEGKLIKDRKSVV